MQNLGLHSLYWVSDHIYFLENKVMYKAIVSFLFFLIIQNGDNAKHSWWKLRCCSKPETRNNLVMKNRKFLLVRR